MQDKIQWHGFVPERIKSLYNTGCSQGFFDCACLSLDISGFTNMSSALNKLGKQGAETISAVLNTCFSIIIGEIIAQAGTVCFFAGDAIMAIFDGIQSTLRAKTAAQHICSFFSRHGEIKTELGTHTIAVRLGISNGQVTWNVYGDKYNKACLFAGKAFNQAVQAQQQADKNSCYIYDNNTILSPQTEIISSFTKNEATLMQGEFRAVYSLFCKFSNSCQICIDEKTTRTILGLCVHHEVFFNGFDCTDKGNTFLIFLGVPHSIEHIENRIISLITDLSEEYGKDISMAVELGTLFAGKIGSKEISTYTCIGEAINLSAHICLAARDGQVLFGETATNIIQKYSTVSELFSIAIKKGSVLVSALVDKKHRTEQNNTLIGFEKEIALIENCLKELQNNKTGSRLYLWGKAGMGKSALVSKLEESCKIAKITCLSMASDNIMQESLLPIRKFLRQYFNCESFSHFQESFFKFILDHAKQEPNTQTLIELKRIALFLKHIIREKNIQEEPEMLESGEILLALQLTIRSLIKNLALLNPIVLIFDDLQWMDNDTKYIIDLLHKDWSDLPILLVVTGRPENRLKVRTRKLYPDERILHIHLRPFSKSTTSRMISSILGGKATNTIIDYVYSKSHGVPFFIEQYTQFLVVNNCLKNTQNCFDLNTIPESLPISVTSVISAIVDKLKPSLKNSINIACVLGNYFYSDIFFRLVSKLHNNELDNKQAEEYKQGLVEGEYHRIWKNKANEIYYFLNRLIRDVAYNTQLSGILTELQAIAGEIIEGEAAKNPDLYADAVYHFEAGGKYGDAARCSEQAAIHCSNYSLEDAENYAERYVKNTLLASNRNVQDSVKPMIFLSGILNQRGKYKKSIQLLKEVILAIDKTNKEASHDYSKALINLGEAYKGLSKYREAHKTLNLAKNVCKSMPNKSIEDLIKLNEIEFMTYIDEGNIDKCFEILKDSEKLVALPGVDPMSIVTVPYNFGITYWTCGKYTEALKAMEKSMELQNTYFEKDLPPIVWTYNNLGAIYNDMQQTEKALENLNKAYTIAKGYLGTEHPLCATILNNIAVSHDIMGNYAQALEFGMQALEIRMSIYGEQHLETGTSINNIGYVYMEKEDYGNARKYFTKALAIYLASAGMESMYSARCHLNLGKVELASGNNDEALRYFEQARALFATLNHEPGLSEAQELISKARAKNL